MTDSQFKTAIQAGLIGSVVKDILEIIPESLKLHPTFFDYGSYVLFMEPIQKFKLLPLIASLVAESWFAVILSITYFLTRRILGGPSNYLRAFGFGSSIWFFLRGLITLAKIHELKPSSPWIIFINLAIGGIFGMVIEWYYNRKEKSV